MATSDKTVATYVTGLAAATIALVAIKRLLTRQHRPPVPPGPKGWPILGNLLDLPTEKPWLKIDELSKEHGDIVFMQVLNTRMLFLTSFEATTELLEHRSATYSDRMQAAMLQLMGFSQFLVALPYGEQWRQTRKLLHPYVHTNAISVYQPIQIAAARTLARRLLAEEPTPQALPALVRTNFAETIVRIVYGIDVGDSEEAREEYIGIPEQLLDMLNEAGNIGRFYVSLFPFLRHVPAWMPGAGFQRFASKSRELKKRGREAPMRVVKAEMVKGTAPLSMVRDMLEDASPDDLQRQDMISNLGQMAFLAGSDTTVASVLCFILAMIRYPDVQKKAQDELDSVLGQERLPEFADRQMLPYVNAVLLETLRWQPVAALGLAHSTLADDVYKGYFIPKGTVIFGTTWSLLHDPEVYPDPEAFRPERFLRRNSSGDWELNGDVRDPRTAAFGYGRRICPGRHLAEQSLFATIATVLATSNITPATDSHGSAIIPPLEVTSGLIAHPKPFPYSVQPRSGKAKQLLDQDATSS